MPPFRAGFSPAQQTNRVLLTDFKRRHDERQAKGKQQARTKTPARNTWWCTFVRVRQLSRSLTVARAWCMVSRQQRNSLTKSLFVASTKAINVRTLQAVVMRLLGSRSVGASLVSFSTIFLFCALSTLASSEPIRPPAAAP